MYIGDILMGKNTYWKIMKKINILNFITAIGNFKSESKNGTRNTEECIKYHLVRGV